MRVDERTEEQKLRSKRVHALVMMVLGAIMAVCALAAGLIALHPGQFPSWMSRGLWIHKQESFRRPGRPVVPFAAWGPAPFARARREKKLVLLHLTTDWSTEGRLMEETTYSDPKTAALIADRFIPVRADAEDFPELASRYGVGTWPATLLLLPDARAVAAATALPPALFRSWITIIDDALRAHPEKAELLAADAGRRFTAVHARGAPDPSALTLDPVWGGAFHGRGEYAKTLEDQASVAASTDAARARSAIGYVEKFLALSDGGWAAASSGEADLPDGRVAQGAYYFSLDDVGRRALGLPALDRRFLPAANEAMAKAILASPAATAAQRKSARRAFRRLKTAPVIPELVAKRVGG